MAVDTEAMQTSIRVQPSNKNHHIWRNHGLWWINLTGHHDNFTKQRLRRSTGTRHLEEARQIRDFLLTVLPSTAA